MTLLETHPDPGDCNRCGKPLSTVTPRGAEFAVNYCPECDDPSTAVLYEPGGRNVRCRACWENATIVVGHHVSYIPEKIVPVCKSCHDIIHDETSRYEHLRPDRTRAEVMDAGVSLTTGKEWREEFFDE